MITERSCYHEKTEFTLFTIFRHTCPPVLRPWFAALIQCLKSQKDSSFIRPFIETAVPAYSTQCLKDSSSYCIYSHEADDYYDYYFYSPLIEAAGVKPIGQGYNVHVAVKKDGSVYLGFPNITCDF